jgi:hypothetical protein
MRRATFFPQSEYLTEPTPEFRELQAKTDAFATAMRAYRKAFADGEAAFLGAGSDAEVAAAIDSLKVSIPLFGLHAKPLMFRVRTARRGLAAKPPFLMRWVRCRGGDRRRHRLCQGSVL